MDPWHETRRPDHARRRDHEPDGLPEVSRKPEVTVEFPPPIRHAAVVWRDFRRTAGVLGGAIEALVGTATVLDISSTLPLVRKRDEDGRVIATVDDNGSDMRIVHSGPIHDAGGSHTSLVTTQMDCTAPGHGRMILSLTCQRSHAPLPHDRDAHKVDMPRFFAGILRKALTVAIEAPGIVVEETPERLRHAVMGAAIEHMEQYPMIRTMHDAGERLTVEGSGRSDFGVETLDLISHDGRRIRARGPLDLPSMLRIAVDHDPDGDVMLRAHVCVQRVRADIGRLDAIDALRMVGAWHEFLDAHGPDA